MDYVFIGDDIYDVNDPAELAEAWAAMREDRIASLPVLRGEPGEDYVKTAMVIIPPEMETAQ
jgi:hypothetical protein